MFHKNIKKRTFEIIQASTEHDLASKIFDICLIVLILINVCLVIADTFNLPEKVKTVSYYIEVLGKILSTIIAILGIGLVAVPTGIISAGFMENMEETKKCEKDEIK